MLAPPLLLLEQTSGRVEFGLVAVRTRGDFGNSDLDSRAAASRSPPKPRFSARASRSTSSARRSAAMDLKMTRSAQLPSKWTGEQNHYCARRAS